MRALRIKKALKKPTEEDAQKHKKKKKKTHRVTTGEALITYRKRRRDIYKYVMRNLLPSSRSLARTKTFFSSSFTVREDEFDKSGFVGGEDEESQRRRRKSQQRKTTNTISCAPSLDEERKHVFVCLESGHVVRARCFVENGKEEEEEEHDAKKTKRRMILLKDTEEEDDEDEEERRK